MKVSAIVAAVITLLPLSSAMYTGPDNTVTTHVASGSATTDSVLGSASAGDCSTDSGVYRTVTVHDLPSRVGLAKRVKVCTNCRSPGHVLAQCPYPWRP
ncbi:hypothetical protein PGT21_002445 [Puccinia graminis f. sp. tritici]|uniref:CCHC-type domain-containing protein n=1 Tax=Puccinia graminis f. sp. tritici TaxID=56615 RepID=A0A5B0NZB6_PUCGR|nr:hypothetical protein PGT21_002445 [Puccinia graminis f. sp. tritici]KAA1129983.1 hypothetical protein PGTUg99_006297 [Puccinia graminis f. sp. tritici]